MLTMRHRPAKVFNKKWIMYEQMLDDNGSMSKTKEKKHTQQRRKLEYQRSD